ncbi:hypothetical protein DIRU0_E32946 [Diutina rugosa]
MAPPPILTKRDGAGVAGYVIIPVAALCVLIFILVHFIHSRRRRQQQGHDHNHDNSHRHVQPLPMSLLHMHGPGHHHRNQETGPDEQGQVYFGTEPAQDPVPLYTKYPTEPPPVYDPKQPTVVRTTDVRDSSANHTNGETGETREVIDDTPAPHYPPRSPPPPIDDSRQHS